MPARTHVTPLNRRTSPPKEMQHSTTTGFRCNRGDTGNTTKGNSAIHQQNCRAFTPCWAGLYRHRRAGESRVAFQTLCRRCIRPKSCRARNLLVVGIRTEKASRARSAHIVAPINRHRAWGTTHGGFVNFWAVESRRATLAFAIGGLHSQQS